MIEQIITPNQKLSGDHSQKMQALGEKTNTIARAIHPGATISYVDYPMHINVGDLLIFLGAMNFFNWNKNTISSSFCLFDMGKNALNSLEKTDVIVCHGGGNFGDIYPKHQRLRETILLRFPDKAVVVMPQSFHFSSRESMHASAKIFAAHKDVTIFVRDQPSYDLAKEYFSDQVYFSPDMAHRLYDDFASVRQYVRLTNSSIQRQPFSLIRRDKEATTISQQVSQKDWTDIMHFGEKLRIERHRSVTKICGAFNRTDNSILFAYHKTIQSIVKAISQRISEHNPWQTSRLHGAILGLLLDRNVSLFDNSYGKNSRYFTQWGKKLVKIES